MLRQERRQAKQSSKKDDKLKAELRKTKKAFAATKKKLQEAEEQLDAQGARRAARAARKELTTRSSQAKPKARATPSKEAQLITGSDNPSPLRTKNMHGLSQGHPKNMRNNRQTEYLTPGQAQAICKFYGARYNSRFYLVADYSSVFDWCRRLFTTKVHQIQDSIVVST